MIVGRYHNRATAWKYASSRVALDGGRVACDQSPQERGTGRRRGGETQRRTKRQQCKLSQAPGRRRRTSPPARRSWAAGFRRACRKGTTTSSGGIVFVARTLQSSLACFNVDRSIGLTLRALSEWTCKFKRLISFVVIFLLLIIRVLLYYYYYYSII